MSILMSSERYATISVAASGLHAIICNKLAHWNIIKVVVFW